MHETRRRHGPFGAGWFGPPPWAGRRARRGDVRAALLALLAEKPMHGYDVIQELESRSGGAWRPSPGSIYPTLQMLEDGGLVTSEDRDGKRVYSLTEVGKAEVEERKERTGGAPPWEFGSGGGEVQMQVARTGTTQQMKQAGELVAEARKKVYAILAQD